MEIVAPSHPPTNHPTSHPTAQPEPISGEEDTVWVQHGSSLPDDLWDLWEDHETCEIVLPLATYDADLGMRTRAAVRRQLDADVPRSVVLVDDVRVKSTDEVLKAASHPRLCTQAVLAPPVEWLLRSGMVVHELRGSFPMVVDVRRDVTHVSKLLGVCTWDFESRRGVLSCDIHADARCGMVIVALQHCKYGNST